MRQFWERGYRATSVDDLVRATGVKPGSLYSAFPGGKHALLMGSLERYSKLVVPQKLGELEDPGASVAQVRAYFDGLVRDLLSPEGRQGCLLVNSAIENAAVDPEVAAAVRVTWRGWSTVSARRCAMRSGSARSRRRWIRWPGRRGWWPPARA